MINDNVFPVEILPFPALSPASGYIQINPDALRLAVSTGRTFAIVEQEGEVMLVKTFGSAVQGVDAFPITIEVNVGRARSDRIELAHVAEAIHYRSMDTGGHTRLSPNAVA